MEEFNEGILSLLVEIMIVAVFDSRVLGGGAIFRNHIPMFILIMSLI
jgi:hypothetical protein